MPPKPDVVLDPEKVIRGVVKLCILCSMLRSEKSFMSPEERLSSADRLTDVFMKETPLK